MSRKLSRKRVTYESATCVSCNTRKCTHNGFLSDLLKWALKCTFYATGPWSLHHVTSTIYTESLRPSQIQSHYKRIIPSRLFLKYPSSHYSIYMKLLIQIFLLSLRQGVPQWWYRSLKLFFILNLQTNISTFYAHPVTPYTLNELFHSALPWEYNVYVPQLRCSICVVTNTSIIP